MHSRHFTTGLLAAGLSVALAGPALAGKVKPWDAPAPASDSGTVGPANTGPGTLQAVPFAFVGTSAQCGGPAGNRIVTAAWLGGMGLPDNGTNNPSSNKDDQQKGLLLNKNGLTTNCSAAGATIKGFAKGVTISELGFDDRLGGHCGAGAPRFNVTSTVGYVYFVGCGAGTHTAAPQDPQWERVRFSAADFFPANPSAPTFVFGTTQVRGIEIIFDEGTDQTSTSDPNGIGLTVLDNIDVNGKLITKGSGVKPN